MESLAEVSLLTAFRKQRLWKNLCWKESAVLFQNARMSRTCILNIWNKWIFLIISYFQSLAASFVSAYYRITTWPPQKKKNRFFLLLVLLGQICFVLVFISPNHKARNRYPEMVIARTVKGENIEKIDCQSGGDHYFNTNHFCWNK